jgi:hypothetical protein
MRRLLPFILVAAPYVWGQGKHLPKGLLDSYARLVTAEKTANYGLSYQMMPSAIQAGWTSKDAYLKQRAMGGSSRGYRLLELKVIKVAFGTVPGVWTISACGRFRKGLKSQDLIVETEAVEEPGGWRFTGLDFQSALDSTPRECNFNAAKSEEGLLFHEREHAIRPSPAKPK